jgi:hypothetical protein
MDGWMGGVTVDMSGYTDGYGVQGSATANTRPAAYSLGDWYHLSAAGQQRYADGMAQYFAVNP